MREHRKITIGFITCDEFTVEYLPYFLDGLRKQDFKNFGIIAVDNSERGNGNIKILQESGMNIEIINVDGNIGFARANNLMIKRALERGDDYFLTTNVDMIYDSNVVSELFDAVNKNSRIASAACKIKAWNFAGRAGRNDGRTDYIDTVGIKITSEHRFVDRGQGDIDLGQFDKEEEIFGASGAAVIYRLSALDDVAFIGEDGKKEYFDELMFMYKEDIDLAYRLQLAGYGCLYVPRAVIFHDRTAKLTDGGFWGIVKNRNNKSRKVKEWSWLNHHIILWKMIGGGYSRNVILSTFWYEFKTLIYVLLFEGYLLKQFWRLFRMKNEIDKKRAQIKKRVNIKFRMEELMEK